MAGCNIRLGRRGGRLVVGLATTAYAAGILIMGASPGNTFGGSCNGRLSTVGLDASREKGPVIIMGGDNTNDVIIGSRSDDTIDGRGGDDVICAGSGADTLQGGEGDDSVYGGHGNDNIVGNDGEDALSGNDGHDILNGIEDPDPAEEDKLDGGDGKNLCFVDALDEPEDCKF